MHIIVKKMILNLEPCMTESIYGVQHAALLAAA
jgi:hypothetical protein